MSQILLLPSSTVNKTKFIFKIEEKRCCFIHGKAVSDTLPFWLIGKHLGSGKAFGGNNNQITFFLCGASMTLTQIVVRAKWYQSWNLARGSLLGWNWYLLIFITHGLVSSIKFKIGIVMVLSSTVFQTQRTMLMTATNNSIVKWILCPHPVELQIMVGVRIWGTDSGECTKQNAFSRQQSRYGAVEVEGLGNCGSGSSKVSGGSKNLMGQRESDCRHLST